MAVEASWVNEWEEVVGSGVSLVVAACLVIGSNGARIPSWRVVLHHHVRVKRSNNPAVQGLQTRVARLQSANNKRAYRNSRRATFLSPRIQRNGHVSVKVKLLLTILCTKRKASCQNLDIKQGHTGLQ
jgi:hypothetical protein